MLWEFCFFFASFLKVPSIFRWEKVLKLAEFIVLHGPPACWAWDVCRFRYRLQF